MAGHLDLLVAAKAVALLQRGNRHLCLWAKPVRAWPAVLLRLIGFASAGIPMYKRVSPPW
jgi:hypothetical protein